MTNAHTTSLHGVPVRPPLGAVGLIASQQPLSELVRIGSRWEIPLLDYDERDSDGIAVQLRGADGEPAVRVDEVVEHWTVGAQLGVCYVSVFCTPGMQDLGGRTYGWSGAMSFVTSHLRVPSARTFPANWAVENATLRRYVQDAARQAV